jgi:hypothetical protein
MTWAMAQGRLPRGSSHGGLFYSFRAPQIIQCLHGKIRKFPLVVLEPLCILHRTGRISELVMSENRSATTFLFLGMLDDTNASKVH